MASGYTVKCSFTPEGEGSVFFAYDQHSSEELLRDFPDLRRLVVGASDQPQQVPTRPEVESPLADRRIEPSATENP
jgi:hypothetical protein